RRHRRSAGRARQEAVRDGDRRSLPAARGPGACATSPIRRPAKVRVGGVHGDSSDSSVEGSRRHSFPARRESAGMCHARVGTSRRCSSDVAGGFVAPCATAALIGDERSSKNLTSALTYVLVLFMLDASPTAERQEQILGELAEWMHAAAREAQRRLMEAES